MRLLFALSLVFTTGLLAAQSQRTVTVDLSSLAAGGTIHLAAYDSSEKFDADEKTAFLLVPLADGEKATTAEIEVPHLGRYVFAAYQDLNDNEEMDKNILGIPKEPYGFGKEPGSKFRAPAFDEISVSVAADPEPVKILLSTWGAK